MIVVWRIWIFNLNPSLHFDLNLDPIDEAKNHILLPYYMLRAQSKLDLLFFFSFFFLEYSYDSELLLVVLVWDMVDMIFLLGENIEFFAGEVLKNWREMIWGTIRRKVSSVLD